MELIGSGISCLRAGSRVLVPTMGALHAGHLSLVAEARRRAKAVVVSIFVNPTQFGPRDDLARYPRPLDDDLALCAGAGVDVVFAPCVAEMYPFDSREFEGVSSTASASPSSASASTSPSISIRIPSLMDRLEGRSRPGHFEGVCQIVAKLFNVVRPDIACFGEKDFQQLAIIRAMNRALDFGIDIVACPTLRDADGLAMSSRNRYLSAAERTRARQIGRGLVATRDLCRSGVGDVKRLRDRLLRTLRDDPASTGIEVDLEYATLVDRETLDEVTTLERPTQALVAMRVGSTRLIDNLRIDE
jgi:pantoate--beta-alanine ligase